MDYFSYGMKEKFWRRNNRRLLTFEETQKNNSMNVCLPDDILEMCLVRLLLTSLANVLLVCKKWRNLTTTPRFMQMRREGLFQSPWLFLFGVVKDGYCFGKIHGLDVSPAQWHKIDAQFLRVRFLFSVASIWDDVFIVGGCSSLTIFGRVDKSSFKTHNRVLVFSPLTKSWHKAASMKYARSSPILGISEVSYLDRSVGAPMDGNAAFVSDKNLIFVVEMFKIFGQVLDFVTTCDVSDTGINWIHVSRNHVAQDLDASSCLTKSLAVLHL
ncbi:F-box/kelch-repeat protein [Abeliophyllum distichum]|uniref:F-box/kelch-repeat protein n=1 Tax=Abeliophyllum distichum TaxID=126358 RepID=A0ABD1SZX5_9LAMI